MSALFTYFLFSKSLSQWKIGRSRSVAERKSFLKKQRKCDDLEVVAVFRFEDVSELDCHAMFEAIRMDGEWFSDHPSIAEFLSNKQSVALNPLAHSDCVEMRLDISDEDAHMAMKVALASGHTSRRRAVLDVFRTQSDRHLREVRQKMREASKDSPKKIKNHRN